MKRRKESTIRLQLAKKNLEKALRKSGYYRSLEKYGNTFKLAFPDLKVNSNCPPTSDTFTTTPGKRQRHPDAKDFPVGNLHKSGLTVVLPGEEIDLTGRKF